MVDLPIQLQHCDGTWCTYDGLFVVLDINENDVIIGLPVILGTLQDFFTESVSASAFKIARNREKKCISTDGLSTVTPRVTPTPVCTMTNTLDEIESAICALREPWTINPREKCLAEAVGLPVQFERAQRFLDKTYEEAVAEYKGLWDAHMQSSADTHHCVA